MIDFWKNYDAKSGTTPTPIRGQIIKHSTYFGEYSYEGLDFERIKAYCKATGRKFERQIVNATFMNEMEEWYLNLAEQYPALDKIRAEIEALPNANPSYTHTCDVVDREDVLDIIDKYKKESEAAE